MCNCLCSSRIRQSDSLGKRGYKFWLFMALLPIPNTSRLAVSPRSFCGFGTCSSILPRQRGSSRCHMFGTLGVGTATEAEAPRFFSGGQTNGRPENKEAHAAQNHQYHILGAILTWPQINPLPQWSSTAVDLSRFQATPGVGITSTHQRSKKWSKRGRKTTIGKGQPSCSRHSCPDHDSGWPVGVAVASPQGEAVSCWNQQSNPSINPSQVYTTIESRLVEYSLQILNKSSIH